MGHYFSSMLKKTVCGACGSVHTGWYGRSTRRVRDLSCADTRVYLEIEIRRVHCRSCGKVKRERLDFLADNPRTRSGLRFTLVGVVAAPL